MKINEIHLQKLIDRKNIWFKNPEDVYYLTSFSSSNLNVFFINQKWYAITDDRYFSNAKSKLKGFEVLNTNSFPFKNFLLPLIVKSGQPLLIDEDFLNIKEFNYLKDSYPVLKIKLISLKSIRTVKTIEEINLIKEAVKITDQIFAKFFTLVKAGKTEKELKTKLNHLLLKFQDAEFAFPPIIAAGKNSANPHWEPSNYVIKKGDMVTVDFGVSYKGYKSDMTRSFSVGPKVKKMHETIFNLVNAGVDKAISLIKPDVNVKELDEAVRELFRKEGYEKYYVHALGHGLGLNIHELPIISLQSNAVLKEGMIITIEPGIYLKDDFGVRIEQDILVTKTGFEVLNKAPIFLSKNNSSN